MTDLRPPAEHEITLPSGIRLAGPTFADAMREYWKHSRASVTEGLCPRHAGPLMPFPSKPGFIGGRCDDCRVYWAYESAREEVHEHFYFAGAPPWSAR